MKILVTGATGMFGGRVAEILTGQGFAVRGLTRSERGAEKLRALGVEPALGDLDDPTSLVAALQNIDHVFLVSPMDLSVGERESRVIQAARSVNVRHVVKLYGAVRHRGDRLDLSHQASIACLRESGLPWTLVSPNTVMESNFFPLAEWIRAESRFLGSAGEGRVGFVALDDCAEVACRVLTSSGHEGQNYEVTGPEAMTFAGVAEAFSTVLGRPVTYQDLPEDELRQVLIEVGAFSEDEVEVAVLCHFRAFRRGDAELVTDVVPRLLGRPATSVLQFLQKNRDRFS
ncbi:SDR family oxidoreductase [bacterium CPR1]|nr:SDR family oxidoreductase [bacterium CPR1]